MSSKLALAICLVNSNSPFVVCPLWFFEVFLAMKEFFFFFTFIQADLLIVYDSGFCVLLRKTFFMPRLNLKVSHIFFRGFCGFFFLF